MTDTPAGRASRSDPSVPNLDPNLMYLCLILLQDEPAVQIQVSTALLLQLIQSTAAIPPIEEHDLQAIQVILRGVKAKACVCVTAELTQPSHTHIHQNKDKNNKSNKYGVCVTTLNRPGHNPIHQRAQPITGHFGKVIRQWWSDKGDQTMVVRQR